MREAPDMGEIARQHYALVYRFCAGRIGPECAQDAAQETFLTAQRAIKKFRGDSSIRTWLLGIAHNECRRLMRRRRAEPPGIELDCLGQDAGDIEQSLVDRQALGEALSRLSPEHREVVLLHDVQGLSYDEAAAVLGVPAGTVKSRLHHAFSNMRRSLGDFGGTR